MAIFWSGVLAEGQKNHHSKPRADNEPRRSHGPIPAGPGGVVLGSPELGSGFSQPISHRVPARSKQPSLCSGRETLQGSGDVDLHPRDQGCAPEQRLAWHQLRLLSMPSMSRSRTANSRNSLDLLLLKSLFLQRLETWQEAGAVYFPVAAPEV